MNYLDLSKKEPNGLEIDSRISSLNFFKPVGSFSAYPKNRSFTIGSHDRIKTPIVKVLKAEDSNKRPTTKIIKWLMSEKLDGLRWVWDGSQFITSSGSVPFYVPDYIKELMPIGVPLDGELWAGRGFFNNVSGISNVKISSKNTKKQIDERWLSFSYNVFDIPESKEIFQKRVLMLEKIIEIRTAFWPKIKKKYYEKMVKENPSLALKFKELECPFRFVKQTEIKSEKHLSETLDSIVDKGGEGLIVRDPKSFYESGRRPKIALKYKKQYDAEAIVIDVLPTDKEDSRLDFLVNGPNNTEHHAMGKMLCKLTDSSGNPILHDNKPIIFKIGTGFSDSNRSNYCNPEKENEYIWNPITKKGAVISFRYMEFNPENGKPRLPRFLRIRHKIDSLELLDLQEKIKKKSLIENKIEIKTGFDLKNRLKRDFRIISLIAQNRSKTLSGSEKRSNTFRIRVYERALETIENIKIENDTESFENVVNHSSDVVNHSSDVVNHASDVTSRNYDVVNHTSDVVNHASDVEKILYEKLTKAPKEKMIHLLKHGCIKLDQSPYNGLVVINGKVNDEKLQKEIEAVITLEPLLNAKVGIGTVLLQKLIDYGYTDLKSLENFKSDERLEISLRKALEKYYNGSIRTVPRMTRKKARKFKKSLSKKMKKIKENYPTLSYKMAGSYARKSPTIGDIDYVICHDGTTKELFSIVMDLLESIEKEFMVSGQKFSIERETVPKSLKKVQQNVMLRLINESDKSKKKLEIYAYNLHKRDYIFGFLDRTASVRKQKELRFKSHALGLSLSGKGFKFRQNNESLKPGDPLIHKIIGKEYFESIEDIYKFVGVVNHTSDVTNRNDD